MTLLKKATLGLALASTAALTAVPAQARDYYGNYYGHHDNAAPAIIAGVLGIAAIAAIASSHHHDHYDNRYTYHDGRRYDSRSRWNGYYNGQYDSRYGGYNGYNDYNGYNGYYGQRYGY